MMLEFITVGAGLGFLMAAVIATQWKIAGRRYEALSRMGGMSSWDWKVTDRWWTAMAVCAAVGLWVLSSGVMVGVLWVGWSVGAWVVGRG